MPSPDYCTKISIILGFSYAEAEKFLQLCGHPPYNPRNPFEAAAIYSFMHKDKWDDPYKAMEAFLYNYSAIDSEIFQKNVTPSKLQSSTAAMIGALETSEDFESYLHKYSTCFWDFRTSASKLIDGIINAASLAHKTTFIDLFSKFFPNTVDDKILSELTNSKAYPSRRLLGEMLIFDLIRKNTSNAKYNSELTTLQQINDSMTRCGYIPFYSVDDLLEKQNGGYMPSFDVFINLSLDHIEQHYKKKKSMVFSDFTNSIPSLINDIFGEEQLPPDAHMFKVTHKFNKITSKSTKCPTPCDTKLSANTKIYSNRLTLEIAEFMSCGGTGYLYDGKATDKEKFFIIKEFFPENFRNSVKRDSNGNLLINDNINAEFMRLGEMQRILI